MLRAAVFACCLALAPALARPDDDGPKPAALAAVAGTLAPSLVRVEYTPQYDKGEPPANDRFRGWYGQYTFNADAASLEQAENWEQNIREERPVEAGGFLVAPTRVYTTDPGVHPRFIKAIHVRYKDQVVAATVSGYPVDQGGVFLDLAAPLKDATPLKFDAAADGPYLAVDYGRREASWATRVTGLRSGVVAWDDGRHAVPNAPGILITGESGTPVALSGTAELPADGSWRIAPESWAHLSAAEYAQLHERIRAAADGGLLRATINFRSPRSSGDADPYGMGRYRGMRGDEGEATEWNGVAIILDHTTVLLPAQFKPKATARLERIRVFLADGSEAAATFQGTLKDWGGIIAKLETPAGRPVSLMPGPITAVRNRLLAKAEVAVRGETRTVHYSHDRIRSYFLSYKGRTFPAVSAGAGASPYEDSAGTLNFLFTQDGHLVAVPMARRERVTAERDRYSYYAGQAVAVPAAQVRELLSAGADSFDPENRPLSEAEENRLAWLGVELQSLNPELARANDVVEQTRNGQSGAIVTYLYAGSPAEKAGIEVGDILLRLHIQNQPRPLEVSVNQGDEYAGMFDQLWARMDEIPAEYFDQIPKPWGSAENSLTRALTDVGFGTPFTAEVFRGGAVARKEFTVEQGPAHYDAAPRFKSEAAGVTVRDMTFEVRRYFQLRPDEPGVIISKVESGGKIAVAGIKPFEIITAVNDAPVNSAADFEKAIAAGGELRLNIKRMTVGRIVKIKLPTAAEAQTP